MNDLGSELQPKKKLSGIEFLLAIAGLGASNENDVSERDEEILASEVHPIRGWRMDECDRNLNDRVEKL